jgi:hypothetical protein
MANLLGQTSIFVTGSGLKQQLQSSIAYKPVGSRTYN